MWPVIREAGADYLTVHVEASTHLHRTLQAIRDAGMRAGVALNPHTPVCAVEEVAEMADMILIMSVNPGFGGQRFIASALDKIGRMKDLLLRKNSAALIQVDGGVNAENAAQLFAAGADVLVAVFNWHKNGVVVDAGHLIPNKIRDIPTVLLRVHTDHIVFLGHVRTQLLIGEHLDLERLQHLGRAQLVDPSIVAEGRGDFMLGQKAL